MRSNSTTVGFICVLSYFTMPFWPVVAQSTAADSNVERVCGAPEHPKNLSSYAQMRSEMFDFLTKNQPRPSEISDLIAQTDQKQREMLRTYEGDACSDLAGMDSGFNSVLSKLSKTLADDNYRDNNAYFQHLNRRKFNFSLTESRAPTQVFWSSGKCSGAIENGELLDVAGGRYYSKDKAGNVYGQCTRLWMAKGSGVAWVDASDKSNGKVDRFAFFRQFDRPLATADVVEYLRINLVDTGSAISSRRAQIGSSCSSSSASSETRVASFDFKLRNGEEWFVQLAITITNPTDGQMDRIRRGEKLVKTGIFVEVEDVSAAVIKRKTDYEACSARVRSLEGTKGQPIKLQ
jgi:predicted transcriptional regulator